MDFQDQFFTNQIRKIHDAIERKGVNFEKLQQEERRKIEEFYASSINIKDSKSKAEEVNRFNKFQKQKIEKFIAEKEKLMRIHDDKKMQMRKRHYENELELQKNFNNTLTKLENQYAHVFVEDAVTKLMNKYAPPFAEDGPATDNAPDDA